LEDLSDYFMTMLYVNTGSQDSPDLKVFLNLANLCDLRSDSVGPAPNSLDRDIQLSRDGFEGVQLIEDDDLPDLLPACGLNRISTPQEADPVIQHHSTRGDLCVTLHVGSGLENDDAVMRLVESTIEASGKYQIPVFFETHRATITQDIWRTVQIVKRFPEIRFNGDFSHYYCGQELVYGNWEEKIAFLEPILSRVGFLHGRIASPGAIQIPVSSGTYSQAACIDAVGDCTAHFSELWLRSFRGFISKASRGDVLIFAPELLASSNFYARTISAPDGSQQEETDRYDQALILSRLARKLFDRAKKETSYNTPLPDPVQV
jgi:hypothetical protein